MKKSGIRNSLILQNAPTGSTSLMSGASSGIEPIYEFEFIRKDRLGEHKIFHPLFEAWKKANPNSPAGGKPDYFVSANDLTPEDHVKVQAVIQEYIDASISKTVNAPKTHTVEDVKRIYEMAYDLGCKGIAYMREGSREAVLNRIETKPAVAEKKEETGKVHVRSVLPRPMRVEGVTYQVQTPVGDAFITINHDDNKEPFELFITVGKSGSDVAAMAEALGRMVSLNLRLVGSLSTREKIKQVIAQLAGIGGARTVGFGENRVRSLPDALAKILARHFGFRVNGVVEDKRVSNGEIKTNGQAKKESNGEQDVVVLQQLTISGGGSSLEAEKTEIHLVSTDPSTGLFDICPDCGTNSLAYEEGCKKCYSCGYSEC